MKTVLEVAGARLVAGLIVGIGSLVGFDAVGGPDAAASRVSQVAIEEQGGGPSAQARAEETLVFILAGQSNMAGGGTQPS